MYCPRSSRAAIHIDFSPPIGELEYVVSEGDGDLEVCLTLANVGSYTSGMTLTTEVTVQLSTTVTVLTFLPRGKLFICAFVLSVFNVPFLVA